MKDDQQIPTAKIRHTNSHVVSFFKKKKEMMSLLLPLLYFPFEFCSFSPSLLLFTLFFSFQGGSGAGRREGNTLADQYIYFKRI